MKVEQAIKAGVVVSIIAVVSIAIKYHQEPAVKQETTFVSLDPMMPRSSNPFCMEVADIEYLVMTSTSAPADTHISISSDDTTSAKNNTPTQGQMLTASGGVFYGASGKEKWYSLPMDGVVDLMRRHGFTEQAYPYWVREDGCKMFGDFIMLAADTNTRPRGTVLETSRGLGIVVDHCAAAESEENLIDVAVTWGE